MRVFASPAVSLAQEVGSSRATSSRGRMYAVGVATAKAVCTQSVTGTTVVSGPSTTEVNGAPSTGTAHDTTVVSGSSTMEDNGVTSSGTTLGYDGGMGASSAPGAWQCSPNAAGNICHGIYSYMLLNMLVGVWVEVIGVVSALEKEKLGATDVKNRLQLMLARFGRGPRGRPGGGVSGQQHWPAWDAPRGDDQYRLGRFSAHPPAWSLRRRFAGSAEFSRCQFSVVDTRWKLAQGRRARARAR